MQEFMLLLVGSALVNNFVLVRFLGICPFLGVTRRVDTALGMGAATTFVMFIAALVTWSIYHAILAPNDLVFLRIVVFILVIAVLVQFVEMVLKKQSPTLYRALGIYLPLITTNCAIMGVALLVVGKDYSFWESVVFSIGAGLGFTLALAIMAGIMEELEFADIPPSLKGSALALLVSGLMSLSFMGFSGLVAM
jgi:electron transport complex protein RnfA